MGVRDFLVVVVVGLLGMAAAVLAGEGERILRRVDSAAGVKSPSGGRRVDLASPDPQLLRLCGGASMGRGKSGGIGGGGGGEGGPKGRLRTARLGLRSVARGAIQQMVVPVGGWVCDKIMGMLRIAKVVVR